MNREVGRTSLGLRIALVYGGFFLFLGMFMPYWPAWLESLGLGPTAIGVLVALTHVLKVITSPLIAQISDASGHRRRVLAVVAGLGAGLFGLYFGAQGFLALAIVTVVSHAFIPAVLPLTEQVAVRAVRRCGIHYGRVRAVGSVTFVVAALAGGLLVERWGIGTVLPFCLMALVATFGAVFLLPGGRDHAPRESDSIGLKPIFRLLGNPTFRRVTLVVALLQASHGAYYALGTVHWQNSGLDAGLIGVLWGIGVAAEILLFIVAGRHIATIAPARVFIVVGLAGCLRWAVTAFSANPSLLLVVQCLHALTYGATHLAMMAYLGKAVPAERAATAQAIYSAGPMGIALGLVLAVVGALYDLVGGYVYLVMAVMCATAAAMSVGFTARATGRTP